MARCSYAHLGPDAAVARALENGFNHTVCPVSVFERRHRRRQGTIRPAGGDHRINVAHQIGEGIRPRFLMPSRQMCVATSRVVDQRWVLLQDLVASIAMPEPELV